MNWNARDFWSRTGEKFFAFLAFPKEARPQVSSGTLGLGELNDYLRRKGEEAFRGSDDAGRQSRDRFRFAGYMTGNAACSRPLGRQRKRQAAPHGRALAEDSQVLAEDSQAAAEDSRNTRAPGPDNRVLGNRVRGNTGHSRNRAQRAHHRSARRRPPRPQPDRPNPSHLATEPPQRSAAPRS